MARTGIKIQVKNTTLGGVPDVNANALLIIPSPDVAGGAEMPFTDSVMFMLRSPDDLEPLGLDIPANSGIIKQVNDFYYPSDGVNNVGTVLWLYSVPAVTGDDLASEIVTAIEALPQTVVNGFEYRPRQVLVAPMFSTGDELNSAVATINLAVEKAWDEGFTINVVLSANFGQGFAVAPTLANLNAPFVGVLVSRDTLTGASYVGKLGGYMAQLPVGTSIGDVSLPPVASVSYLTNGDSTPVATLTQSQADGLGEKQYIFARTRPPKNGLWFNDGATAADPSTALSSLEAVRTLGAIVDDLRLFFTSYINSKVPVTSDGDIQPAYKQVVLDNAFAKVVAPYIESGDISDARLSLVAKNNDMVGTRTWEVSLSVLPAPTLRWIDGFVFYVKNLS